MGLLADFEYEKIVISWNSFIKMSYHLEVLENLRKAEFKFSEVAISEKTKLEFEWTFPTCRVFIPDAIDLLDNG